MDRRYEAFKRLPKSGPIDVDTMTNGPENQVLLDGKESEFWFHVKQEVDQQIRAAESRFLDTLAKDYDTYVAYWSRRQALIAVLAIPETSTKKE